MLKGCPRILRGHADRSMVGPTIGCHAGAAELLHVLHKFLSSNQQRAEQARAVTSHRNDSNRHPICPQTACGQSADSADIRNLADNSEFRAHRLAALAVSGFGPVSLRLYIHRGFRCRDRANRSMEPSQIQPTRPSRRCSPPGKPLGHRHDSRFGLSANSCGIRKSVWSPLEFCCSGPRPRQWNSGSSG